MSHTKYIITNDNKGLSLDEYISFIRAITPHQEELDDDQIGRRLVIDADKNGEKLYETVVEFSRNTIEVSLDDADVYTMPKIERAVKELELKIY